MFRNHLASLIDELELARTPALSTAPQRCGRNHGRRAIHLLALELDDRSRDDGSDLRVEVASCPRCRRTLANLERWLAELDHPRPVVAPEFVTRQKLWERLSRHASHEKRRAAVRLHEEYHHWGLCRLLIDQTRTLLEPPLSAKTQESLAALFFADPGLRGLFGGSESEGFESPSPSSFERNLRTIAYEEVAHLLPPQARTALGLSPRSAVELSELALTIASRLDVEVYGTRHVADLRAWAHALHAAALDSEDQTELVSEHARAARQWLSEGTERDVVRTRVEDLLS